MNRPHVFVTILLLLVLPATLTRADGLLYSLPEDGTWATYGIRIRGSEKVITGQGKEISVENPIQGTLRMASVGRVTEANEMCRWIEIETTVQIGMLEPYRQVFKILVPEKFLAPGESVLDHAVQIWGATDGDEPKELTPDDFNSSVVPLALLLAPNRDIVHLDEVEIESKLGKISCGGVRGTLDFRTKGEREGLNWKCKLETRLHPKSPFGVVTSRWVVTISGARRITQEWDVKLLDVGNDARSAMRVVPKNGEKGRGKKGSEKAPVKAGKE